MGQPARRGPKPPPPPPKQPARFSPMMMARLRTMAAQGHPATSIVKALQLLAPLMSITPDTVRRKAVCLGIRLRRRGAGRLPSSIEFRLSADSLEKIRTVAYARGLSVGQFTRLMIETVVRDGLVDAVLDAPTRDPVAPGSFGGRPRAPKPQGPADANEIN